MSDAGTLKGAGQLLSGMLKNGRGKNVEIRSHVPVMSWQRFLEQFSWKQGEHVTLLGTTGSGKTTLALEILPRRDYVVAFGTKRLDDTFSGLLKRGYTRINSWPPPPGIRKVLLWPHLDGIAARDVKPFQREVFGDALNEIYQEGAWAVFLDELRYITDILNLDEEYELLMQQGRSLHISVLGGTQRPRFIPLVAYDQATHLFFWRENDNENIKRIAGIGWSNREEVEAIVSSLPPKTFLYLDTRTGKMAISKVKL
jgi:hypothetical protein